MTSRSPTVSHTGPLVTSASPAAPPAWWPKAVDAAAWNALPVIAWETAFRWQPLPLEAFQALWAALLEAPRSYHPAVHDAAGRLLLRPDISVAERERWHPLLRAMGDRGVALSAWLLPPDRWAETQQWWRAQWTHHGAPPVRPGRSTIAPLARRWLDTLGWGPACVRPSRTGATVGHLPDDHVGLLVPAAAWNTELPEIPPALLPPPPDAWPAWSLEAIRQLAAQVPPDQLPGRLRWWWWAQPDVASLWAAAQALEPGSAHITPFTSALLWRTLELASPLLPLHADAQIHVRLQREAVRWYPLLPGPVSIPPQHGVPWTLALVEHPDTLWTTTAPARWRCTPSPAEDRMAWLWGAGLTPAHIAQVARHVDRGDAPDAVREAVRHRLLQRDTIDHPLIHTVRVRAADRRWRPTGEG
jgi:hypothetical protein